MSPTTTTAIEPRYLTFDEAARYLRVSIATFRRLLDREAIKALRPSPNRIVFDRQALDAYLQASVETK